MCCDVLCLQHCANASKNTMLSQKIHVFFAFYVFVLCSIIDSSNLSVDRFWADVSLFLFTHWCRLVTPSAAQSPRLSAPTSDQPCGQLPCANDAVVTICSRVKLQAVGLETGRGALFWTLALACEVGVGNLSLRPRHHGIYLEVCPHVWYTLGSCEIPVNAKC